MFVCKVGRNIKRQDERDGCADVLEWFETGLAFRVRGLFNCSY